MGEAALRTTMREQLESLAGQGDTEAIAELEAQPELPAHAAYLWGWFGDLRATLQGNGMSPPRITRHDIHAWERDEFTTLQSWERAAILRLDAAYLRSSSEAQS